jgi:hypothetical protein
MTVSHFVLYHKPDDLFKQGGVFARLAARQLV